MDASDHSSRRREWRALRMGEQHVSWACPRRRDSRSRRGADPRDAAHDFTHPQCGTVVWESPLPAGEARPWGPDSPRHPWLPGRSRSRSSTNARRRARARPRARPGCDVAGVEISRKGRDKILESEASKAPPSYLHAAMSFISRQRARPPSGPSLFWIRSPSASLASSRSTLPRTARRSTPRASRGPRSAERAAPSRDRAPCRSRTPNSRSGRPSLAWARSLRDAASDERAHATNTGSCALMRRAGRGRPTSASKGVAATPNPGNLLESVRTARGRRDHARR